MAASEIMHAPGVESMTDDALATHATPAPGSRWRLMRYLPLVVFFVIAAFLAIGLIKDPREVPSPLIGKPVPKFNLPPVKGRTLGLASANLRGQVSLVNVFASWCVACREEHPVLLALSKQRIVPIHGLDYKDKPDDAQAWLDALGDPYTRTGADISGRVGIDWGVYGAPETFVVDRNGVIAYKQIGPMTPKALEETILPLVRKLEGTAQ
jgi:cytochrome c biogenesis protein CcmG, thiol:disulfide interchange protein DsbE